MIDRRVGVILVSILVAMSVIDGVAASSGIQRVERAFQSGEITYQEALSNKLYYAFDRSRMDPRVYNVNDPPLKCATAIILEFQVNRHLLDSSTIQFIETLLSDPEPPDPEEPPSIYFTLGGKFKITYWMTGQHYVPDEDVDENGVPDYVERIGSYLDYSWEQEIDVMGFRPPNLKENRYDVKIKNLGDTYGMLTYHYGDEGLYSQIIINN